MNREPCASFAFVAPGDEAVDTFHYEKDLVRQGFTDIAGLDEAGRGPLAGPVVAACVILPPACDYGRFRDSKQLSARRRRELHAYVLDCGARIGVSVVDAAEIDRLNILQASLQAMKRAAEACLDSGLPGFLLVDGKFTVPMALPQLALVKGESRSASIAAASIVAKETRDRLMEQYHRQYPVYNFLRNKGYPTREHRQALVEHGPCPIHRRTFRGVREFFEDTSASPQQQGLW
ncbi:MAG TPA: ribonuclease HII [Desulfobulbus sp.]|nr:ribonuclease HII [Desulfobulbus sp.]